MRNKFTELIEQGVAQFSYTPVASETTEQDPICRMYNNIWSIPSDTHMFMDHETGNRYITGYMVGTDKWNNFLYASNWGAVNFKSTGHWSLNNFLQAQGLCGTFDTLNCDLVYRINNIPVELKQDCNCPACYTTTESKIPTNIASITYDGNTLKIKECYKDKNNLYEVCEALNDSIYVKGNSWTVVGENVMCPIGNKVVIL